MDMLILSKSILLYVIAISKLLPKNSKCCMNLPHSQYQQKKLYIQKQNTIYLIYISPSFNRKILYIFIQFTLKIGNFNIYSQSSICCPNMRAIYNIQPAYAGYIQYIARICGLYPQICTSYADICGFFNVRLAGGF